MQQKWKNIISNWINCYFCENNNKNVISVNQESLLNIINHLRSNFNLDESKSSIFSGLSLEEFIVEKFPGFKFENGTVDVLTEEDIFIAASLLLFFVCVNSKDVDLKSAMCSKLSTDDQEVILKFSKTLMRCPPTSVLDVVAAITEACGTDVASAVGGCSRVLVAETPPALRSLHSEVRRLQAALDAERFDKNYLQDELARTNLKLEKSLKDKEQYKVDIVNLKAKISMCCGQEAETREREIEHNEIAKITKQLQEMEQSVFDLQGQLEEVHHERDEFKVKLEDLKVECDRLLILNQQGTSRANELAEELENERIQNRDLRDLVTELRQHNYRNGFDSSLLECDDPDSSVQSLQRSFSVCTEVCANVVEVQLGEERAKIQSLKQQIQLLQDQVNEQLQNAEKFKEIISDRENDIFNLKHRINEEIEDKNHLKSYYDDEITKLNNIVNELEQKVKENSEHSRITMESNMKNIQTLQEEKLSLIQSFSDETIKTDNIIKELKAEIDTEKSSKVKIRDDYENQVMKYKEKVLNRNNELVELQNNVLQKSEMIEQMSLELRKERELKDETINKFNNDLATLNGEKANTEKELQNKCVEVTELMKQLRQCDDCIENMAKDLECFKITTASLKEDCSILEETNKSLLSDIQKRQVSGDKMRKELDNLRRLHSEEKDNLQCELDEMCAMVKSLQTQLQNEIDFKMGLQQELEKTQGVITKLSNTNTKLHTELSEITLKIQEKDEIINKKDLVLHEQQDKIISLKQEYDELQNKTEQLSNEVLNKNKTLLEFENKLQNLNKSLQEETTKNNEVIDLLNGELATVHAQNHNLQDSIAKLISDKDVIIKEKVLMLSEEKEAYKKLKQDYDNLKSDKERFSNQINEKDKIIQEYESKLVFLSQSFKEEIIKNNETIYSLNEVLTSVDKQNQSLQEFINSLTREKDEIIREKDFLLHEEKEIHRKLKQEYDKVNNDIKQLSSDCIIKENLIQKCETELRHLNKSLQDEISKNNEIVASINKDLANVSVQKQTLQDDVASLNEEKANLIRIVSEKSNFISQLEQERESLSQKMEEKGAIIHSLEKKLNDKMLGFMQIENNFGIEISKLVTKLSDTERTFKDIKTKSNNIIENQELQIQSLNADIFNLKGKLETGLKAKAKLEKSLKEISLKNDTAERDYHNKCKSLEDKISTLTNEIAVKEKEVCDLNIKNLSLSSLVNEKEKELCLLRDTNNEWRTNKEVMDDYLKKEGERLLTVVEETNIKNKELKEDLEIKARIIQTLEEEAKVYTNEKAILEKEKLSYETLFAELQTERNNLNNMLRNFENENHNLIQVKSHLESKLLTVQNNTDKLEKNLINVEIEKKEMQNVMETNISELQELVKYYQNELEDKVNDFQSLEDEKLTLSNDYGLLQDKYTNIVLELDKTKNEQEKLLVRLNQAIKNLEIENDILTKEKHLSSTRIADLECEIKVLQTEVTKLKEDNLHLTKKVEEDKTVISNLEKLMATNLEQTGRLQENLTQAELNHEQRNAEISELRKEIEILSNAKVCEDLKYNNNMLREKCEEREIKIHKLVQELEEERAAVLLSQKEIKSREFTILELKQKLSVVGNEKEEFEKLKKENVQFLETLRLKQEECDLLQGENNEWKIQKDALEIEFEGEKSALQSALKLQVIKNEKLEKDVELQIQDCENLKEKLKSYDITISELQNYKNTQEKLIADLEQEIDVLKTKIDTLLSEKDILIQENNDNMTKLKVLQNELDVLQNEKLIKLTEENLRLTNVTEKYKSDITTLEVAITKKLEETERLLKEKSELSNKFNILQEHRAEEEQLEEQRATEVNSLKEEINRIAFESNAHERHLKDENENLTKIVEERNNIILKINDELSKEKLRNDEYYKEVQLLQNNISSIEKQFGEFKDDAVMRADLLLHENEELTRRVKQIESNDAVEVDGQQLSGQDDRRDLPAQVDTISSNVTHSSVETNNTINDLEKILNDKNIIITTLHSDITVLKSMLAESENIVLDITKELDLSKENCQQLSTQLKKIVHQKNDEIMDLKKQVAKMSVTENRASQIIKVSAKYQEIIHKRIAEIKSNTVLKELTNFGNTTHCESELKRSLNSGAITMEDLENYLETTDRQLRRCSEKRIALQKERDRLVEVNRMNESNIINIRKFLTELSVSVKTFNSLKEKYTQKLSTIVLLQRTVRREILNVEDRLADDAMCRLERSYGAVMQDLVECSMNLERWVERSVGRAISVEKIKQAFTNDNERASLAPITFQDAGLEVQMKELEKSFQKVLEEVARALKGDGVRHTQATTVKEVRAEYEDKLTRMKAKMKELYCEQIEIFKKKQRQEIVSLEIELEQTRDKLEETSKAYEEHIRGLTSELWRLGEKLVDKTEETDRPRRNRADSLMSLQHMPTSGYSTHHEDICRASDTLSLRSLPVNVNKKKEGRGLHMSDEEGEVFDNRYLRELRTPRATTSSRASDLRTSHGDAMPRLSELRWRNSLCPPHLKSCYPAETQFVSALHEEDIKAGPTNASVSVRQQRKEVGITAYKKPGPPTPSKQAGRLSATDSELRESLRVEMEPQAMRKTNTPSRLRSLFSSARSETVEGTPRSRRLSNFFRKK